MSLANQHSLFSHILNKASIYICILVICFKIFRISIKDDHSSHSSGNVSNGFDNWYFGLENFVKKSAPGDEIP